MDAVGQVIREQGFEALSIDAVAKAAGIGKASVLYDFKSRDMLLTAFVEREMELHRQAIEDLRKDFEGQPDATVRAMLHYSDAPPSQDDVASCLVIAAAAGSNEDCRARVQAGFAREVAGILSEARAPRRALIAYLALHGLMTLESFDLCRFDDATRRQALADISELIRTSETGPAAPAGLDADLS